jgi:hypothetical protein
MVFADHHVTELSRHIVERGHPVEFDQVIVWLGRLRWLLVTRARRLFRVSVIAVGMDTMSDVFRGGIP